MNDKSADATVTDQAPLSDIPLDSEKPDDSQSTMSTPSKTNQSTATVTSQPRSAGSGKGFTRVALHMPFDEAHSERDWSSGLCSCRNSKESNRGSCCWMCCCWPYYRYTVSTRLGETPFMPLIPCAAFALRVKMRALFSIKGSLISDFFTSLCCEPCVICQMVRELDSVGL